MPANLGFHFLSSRLRQQISLNNEDIPYHSSVDCQESNEGFEYVTANDRGDAFFRADLIGSACSCFALFFVGMIILTDKRIRGHPNNIIAFICMSDAFTYFQYITRFVVCGFDLNQYFNYVFALTIQYPIYYIFEE